MFYNMMSAKITEDLSSGWTVWRRSKYNVSTGVISLAKGIITNLILYPVDGLNANGVVEWSTSVFSLDLCYLKHEY